MRIRTIIVALSAAAVLSLAGCSSSSHDGGSGKGVAEPGTTTAAAVQAARTLDARAIAGKLTASIPTVSVTVEYTAASDPNKRLGRPHEYTSKLQFADSRVDQAQAKDDSSGDKTDIAYGGTVEVFTSAADAKAWVSYVDGIDKALGGMMAPDYVLRQGRYVFRVSHLLTPAQVGPYKTVLAGLS